MFKKILFLLFPTLITSCSSFSPQVAPTTKSMPSGTMEQAKTTFDVWSTEIEICRPWIIKPCSSTKINTFDKPTEIGFLYYYDNGTSLTPIQAIQAPLTKMPTIVPQKGMFSNSKSFSMGIFLKSKGFFSISGTPSTKPNFFPLKIVTGYHGTPEGFYKYFNDISYTIKSMAPLNSQQQASITIDSTLKESSGIPGVRSDPYHIEFRAEDIQPIFSGAVTPKPQQVEPIVIGQKVGLKKW